MNCNQCNQKIPENSLFCTHCGKKIEKSIPMPVTEPACDTQYTVQETLRCQSSAKKNKIKTRYCSRCGALIDTASKQCTGCGKQYFKGIRFNKFSFSAFILTLVLLGSILTNIYLSVQVRDMQTKIETLEDHCANLQNELVDFEKSYTYAVNSIELLQKRIEALEAATTRSDMTYSEWKEKHTNDNNA